MDITKIPTEELLTDRVESLQDIQVCRTALAQGITEYSNGKSVQHRLDVNREIVVKIDSELARRKELKQ